MARIKSPRPNASIDTEDFVSALNQALKGEELNGGPVVFEIAQADTAYFQVVIVWERWANLATDVRNRIVVDAYRRYDAETDESVEQNISMILPVTTEQALDMNLLPYPIQCDVHKSQDQYPQVQSLMRQQGAIETPDGTQLRLPTLEMAREARGRLREATKDWNPAIQWTLYEQAGRIYEY